MTKLIKKKGKTNTVLKIDGKSFSTKRLALCLLQLEQDENFDIDAFLNEILDYVNQKLEHE